MDVVVDGAEPSTMAAERSVSRPALVEQLREAVGALLIERRSFCLAGRRGTRYPARSAIILYKTAGT
jgi:hypothetical protein